MDNLIDFRGIKSKSNEICVLFYQKSYEQCVEVLDVETYLQIYGDENLECSGLFLLEDSDELSSQQRLDIYSGKYQVDDGVWRDVTGKSLSVGDFVYFANVFGDDYIYPGIVIGDRQVFSSCCRVKSVEQVFRVEHLIEYEKKEKSKLSLLYKNRAIKTKFERGDVLTNDSCLYICLGKSRVVCSHKVGRNLDSFEVSGDNVFYNLGSLDIGDIHDSISLLGKHASCSGFILYTCLNAKIRLSLKKYKSYKNSKLTDMLNSRKIGFSKHVSGLKFIKHIDSLDECLKDMNYADEDTGITMRFILE